MLNKKDFFLHKINHKKHSLKTSSQKKNDLTQTWNELSFIPAEKKSRGEISLGKT